MTTGVGDGECRKIPEEYFSENYHANFRHFLGKCHVKFMHFVNFSYIYFRAKRRLSSYAFTDDSVSADRTKEKTTTHTY